MEELRQEEITSALLKTIKKKIKTIGRRVRIMEVCGTHTMTVYRYGLKNLLEEAGVELLSGPGCPVCITPDEYHEIVIDLLTKRDKMIVATFGDMTRVPTSRGSLQTAVPAPSSFLKIVYSPIEALQLAQNYPDYEIVLFGAGFETTIPSLAFTIKEAQARSLRNFSLLAACWLIPPPLRAILESGEVGLDGFLYPGHVSAIIGSAPYRFIAEEFKIAGAITGFEPNDILLGIIATLDQIINGIPEVAIEYCRAVSVEGNPKALALMAEVFEVKDAFWRGLGFIPQSGLTLKNQFEEFDTLKRFSLNLIPSKKSFNPACRCGEVLRGLIQPTQCSLYERLCRPESPYGPCMVSFEGACLIYYKFGQRGKS
ncbi:MAG: hydrogenase formation protein HypD [Candidatus Aminicenantes bacterium]|nr:hydrogenase formation protein HypD [Candidatus Aminicenantes bacterium]